MASVLRTGLVNLNPIGLLGGLCKVAPKHRHAVITQVSFISSREQRHNRPPRPPPFDFRHKEYNSWQFMVDPMQERLDDNSKVVVVEGLPGVGKNKFAKTLAEDLEMRYIPPPSFDDIWITPHGFDYRSLNSKLPIDAQFWDINAFLNDPNSRNSAVMQVTMYILRYSQYIDALVEVLSTGQGVVLVRSPYSDANFMQAMLKSNYISKGAADFYKCSVLASIPELMRPHLVLYLDAPISVIKDNIKKRNNPHEVNSKALTEQYLQDLENSYKEVYLREVTKHSHLLIYDWSREGDVGIVVEDIERLSFEIKDQYAEKFCDWYYDDFSDLKIRRGDYCNYKEQLMSSIFIARLDVPEMLKSAEANIILEEVMRDIPDATYQPGFNPAKDKGLLFKLWDKYEDWLPQKKIQKQQ